MTHQMGMHLLLNADKEKPPLKSPEDPGFSKETEEKTGVLMLLWLQQSPREKHRGSKTALPKFHVFVSTIACSQELNQWNGRNTEKGLSNYRSSGTQAGPNHSDTNSLIMGAAIGLSLENPQRMAQPVSDK